MTWAVCGGNYVLGGIKTEWSVVKFMIFVIDKN
jgi:hypothetical protein